MTGTLGKGSRSARLTNAALHILGSGLSAAAAGFGLAVVGGLVPDPVGPFVATSLCFAYGMMEIGLVRLPLPETGRQVPATWRYRFPAPVTVTLYGALLGPGIGTRVATASYVALLGVVTLASRPVQGAVVLGMFGLARSTAAVIAAQLARHDPTCGLAWGYRFADSTRLPRFMLMLFAGSSLLAGVVINHLGV